VINLQDMDGSLRIDLLRDAYRINWDISVPLHHIYFYCNSISWVQLNRIH
jgi:hypothetical protein